jgi:apolipoprotein N-acyltransferase
MPQPSTRRALLAPPREARFRARWAALLAVAAGLVGVLAFPRFGSWPLAIVSVAMFVVAVDGRRSRTAAWLGYLYGAAFMVPLISWTGIYVGPAPWLILALAEAVFFAALGAALPLLARLPLRPAWVGAGWVLEEFLRDRVPFGGFPWGRLAFSQSASPMKWFAALGGQPLLSFAVATAGAALAVAALGVWPRRTRVLLAGVAGAVAVPVLGAMLAWPLDPGSAAAGRTTTIAVVQGGLPDLGLDFESRARQVLDNHVRETLLLAREIRTHRVARPSIVLWPENSSDVDPYTDAVARREIFRAARAVGVPILVGAIQQGPGPNHRRNVGILWSPTAGPIARYVKRHPVPFGEYMPLRSLAEKVTSVAATVEDMVAGHGDGLLRGGPFPLGDVICFEVAYDGLVHSSVAAGAQLLVVQTNNSTFGHTAETYQQLAMSRLRAVETGRTVAQVATTGESAVIAPDGSVLAESGPLFAPALLVDRVPLRTVLTPADRVGAVPEYVLAGLAVVGLVSSAGSALRRRRSPGPPSPPVEEANPAPDQLAATGK